MASERAQIQLSALQPGAVVSGRYRLIRPLGRGGMGSVWVASHLGLNTDVALKFVELDAGDRESLLARFKNEAMAVARARCPNVISVLDYGFDEALGRPFLAMELLGGESLGARLEREGRLPLPEVVEIIRQACRGLGRAHSAGIVHRDVKPDNIFLCPEEDSIVVKVLDFGVAKASLLSGAAAYKTTAGSLIGTPMYMSPEQAHGGRAIDHRSDLFSLGVVAYHCLTGRPPFEASGLGELLVAIATRPFPPPSSLNPGLPPAVEQWLVKALEKDPDRRFQSAREMSHALLDACNLTSGESARAIRAVPPTFLDTELQTPVPLAVITPAPAVDARVDTKARTQAGQGAPGTFSGTVNAGQNEPVHIPRHRFPVAALAGGVALAVIATVGVTLLRRGNEPEPPSAPAASSPASAAPLQVSALVPGPPSAPPAASAPPPEAGAPDAGSRGVPPKDVRPSTPPKRGTGKGGFQL